MKAKAKIKPKTPLAKQKGVVPKKIIQVFPKLGAQTPLAVVLWGEGEGTDPT